MYINEKLIAAKEFGIAKGADVATGGTIQNLNTTTSSYLRLTGATTLESVLAPSTSPIQAKQVTIVNATAGSIIINNETGGTVANRILTGIGGNLTLPQNASVVLMYDDTAQRWRIISAGGGAGDVRGPASSSTLRVPVFADTSGKILKETRNVIPDAGGWVTTDGTGASFTNSAGTTLTYFNLTVANTHTITINGTLVSGAIVEQAGGTLIEGTGNIVELFDNP